ncbi:NAD(P)-dependent alcohol dehydrogenase [Streptomyces sp. NPDC093252]|uniref:quinone oxidoreductase family protein n=1 Tax=Streptomyces sp. NPDC093252 TaxID=3154980 RepID=UPI003412B944
MVSPLMKAVLFDRFGGPEVLYVGRVPRPEPASGEVLVRVAAFSVNSSELMVRTGRARFMTGRKFPMRTGLDFTGEIEALGTGATGVAVGDRVWGVLGRGSWFRGAAEFLAVPTDGLGRIPDELDPVAAAALPATGSTALTALRDKAALRPGERLLVRGAAGGVGNAAVQLGKAYGAEVTALARGANLDFVRELGADHAVDHRTVSPAELGRFDVVLDSVGTDLRTYRRLLAPGGRMVAVAIDSRHLAACLFTVAASTVHGRGRIRFFSSSPDRALLDAVADEVRKGRLRPAVDRVFPLAETGAAHRALEAGGVRGKYVVRVD